MNSVFVLITFFSFYCSPQSKGSTLLTYRQLKLLYLSHILANLRILRGVLLLFCHFYLSSLLLFTKLKILKMTIKSLLWKRFFCFSQLFIITWITWTIKVFKKAKCLIHNKIYFNFYLYSFDICTFNFCVISITV